MRILRIFYDWPGDWSGLAPAGYEMTKEQANRGHKITIMCGFWKKVPPTKIKDVNIIPIFRELLPGTIYFTSSIFLFFYYFLWRNTFKVDVIHSHGHFAIWIYLYRKLVRRINYLKSFEYEPVFITHFHNTFKGRWEALKREGKRISWVSEKISYPLGVLSDKWALETSDQCIFVSENLLLEAIKYYSADIKKCKIVENGVNIDLFKPVSPIEKSKTKSELGFDDLDKLIINYGKMVPRKNITNIILALKYLPQNYKLLLIGDAPFGYEQEIINTITDNLLVKRVKKYPSAKYYDVPVFLQASDVFVLPSSFEGMPKVVLEALSTNIPAIYSGFNFKEDVQGSCYLEDISPQGIANKIQEVLERGYKPNTEVFRVKYSWRSKVNEIEDIYKNARIYR
jgi:glycosyltransferase involved in cell wall biosynthesis